MIEVTAAGVVVYRIHHTNQREYLLLHSCKGHWDFPKGKQEPGETNKETALRELREETGLTVALLEDQLNPISWTFKENGIVYHKTGIFFIGQAEQQAQIVLSDEHHAYAWLPYQQARDRLSHATSRLLLEQAEEILQ